MTSKLSYSKYIKEDIQRRGWLAALSWVLLLFGGTFNTVLALENRFSSGDAIANYEQLRIDFPGMLNGANAIQVTLFIFLLAILCAATGYSYLHSAEKIDFYHSLPVTRPQWFRISYVSGILIFLVPYLVSGFCTLLVGWSKNILTTKVLIDSCIAILGGILAFLVIYQIAILAMMLTGKLVTGVLAALVLIFYGNMVWGLSSSLTSAFFKTYCSSHPLTDAFVEYASPFSVFAGLIHTTSTGFSSEPVIQGSNAFITMRFAGTINQNPFLLFVTVLMLAILGILSVQLYKKRPSEAAGNALAFPKTAPYIKVLISIPASLYLGLFFDFQESIGTKWIILSSVLFVILLCGIIEFIYHTDLHRVVSGKISSLISILAVIGILCIMQFDLFGYDTWLPKESKLESMSFSSDCFGEYFTYPSDFDNYSYGYDFLEQEGSQIQDFAPLYSLAEEGIANVKSGISPRSVYTGSCSDDYIVVTIRFNKNGSHSQRCYAVSKTSALKALATLCSNEEYRKTLFPIFHLDYDMVRGIQLNDIYVNPVSLDLSKKQQDALLDAYKKDVLAVDISTLQNESPIGELSIDIPDNNVSGDATYDSNLYTWTLTQFYLYSSYENTLSLLKEYGYSLRTEIALEDVVWMSQIESDYTDDTIAVKDIDMEGLISDESMITDPEEMKKILSQIHYPCPGILGGKNHSSRSVQIMMKGEIEANYYEIP